MADSIVMLFGVIGW